MFTLIFPFSWSVLVQRDRVSLKASPDALPEFPDDDSWYYFVCALYLIIQVFTDIVKIYRLSFALTRGLHAMLNLLVDKPAAICKQLELKPSSNVAVFLVTRPCIDGRQIVHCWEVRSRREDGAMNFFDFHACICVSYLALEHSKLLEQFKR